MTNTQHGTDLAPVDRPLEVGDVVEDSYANPAVVVSVRGDNRWATIMQTVGSDRGRMASMPTYHRFITGPRADNALAVAREEWRKGKRP